MKKKSSRKIKKSINSTKLKQDIMVNRDIINYILSILTTFIGKKSAKSVLCLIFISLGLSTSVTASIISLSLGTVYKFKKYILKYEKGNIFNKVSSGRKPKLAGIEQEVLKKIESHNYYTRQQIADMIEEDYSIKVSLQTITRFLRKHGIKRLKCGSLPAKADPVAQRSFYVSCLCPLIEKAKEGSIALLSVDAAHFVMGCDYLGYIYGRARRFVKTFSGRVRYNVLAALNLATKTITTVTNDTYITATQVCELLKKIHDEYVGIPVYLILDNARYQKCKIVKELAEKLGINLVYIPPYSPNLNMIERIWKHVKSRLRTKYYDQFKVFCNTIDSILKCNDVKDRKAIDKLIGEKVQLFDDLKPINDSVFVSGQAEKKAA